MFLPRATPLGIPSLHGAKISFSKAWRVVWIIPKQEATVPN